MQRFSVSDASVVQWSFTQSHKKASSKLLLNENMSLQSFVTKKKTTAETNLPQFILTTTEALPRSHDFSYVNSCMPDRLLHAKLH